MHKTSFTYPAYAILIIIIFLIGVLNLYQIYFLKSSHLVPNLIIGSDYLCFYGATKNLLLRGTPYDKSWYTDKIDDYIKPLVRYAYNPSIPWYCFPPIAASLNYPLSFLETKTAARLSFFLIFFAVIIAYGLVVAAFDFAEKRERKKVFLYGLLIILLSYPVYFLIARGHFIGITFFLIAAGLYLFKKNNLFSGVCFGIATGMFLFPALIIVPLLIFRRYKTIFSMGTTVLALVLLCPDLWMFFIENILMLRVATKDIVNQNCSFAAVFLNGTMFLERIAHFFGAQIKFSNFYNEASLIVFGVMLSIMVVTDFLLIKKHKALGRNIEIALMLMYCPFMIAVPKVTFPYVLILLLFLIPAVCMLKDMFPKQMPEVIFWFLTGGIALSQFQAQSFDALWQQHFFSFHFFSGLGLLGVMIGCVAYKVWLCKQKILQT